MSELQDLSYAEAMALQARLSVGIEAMVAARDVRYAESIQDFADTVVTEIPIAETPTSNFAGHRVSFKVTSGDRDYVATVEFRDVKRSAERKVEKAAADALAALSREPEKEKAKV